MSVTAAKGFVASGVHCGIRKKDASTSRSSARSCRRPARGCSRSTACSRRRWSSRKRASRARQPQAVVTNSGVANAATGERGAARRARDRGRDGAAARPRHRGGARPLDRRDRRAAAARERHQPACAPRPRQLSRRTAAPTPREAIMTTDTHAKEAVAHGTGFTVGGMAKGSGMIHPQLATMLAVVTTDYPLEPGEAIEFLRPAVDTSFNAISVDGECSTNDTVILLANGASGIERTPATDAEFALCIRKVCGELAKQIVADGEGATVLAEIAVRGAASESRSTRDRRARRDLAAREDGAVRARRELGPRSPPPPARRSSTAASRSSTPTRSRSRSTAWRCSSTGAPTGDEPALTNGHCAIELDLALGDGARELPDDRPLLRLRADQRGVPHMTRRAEGRRRVDGRRRGGGRRAARHRQPGVRRPRRRAADLGGDGAARPRRPRSSAGGA